MEIIKIIIMKTMLFFLIPLSMYVCEGSRVVKHRTIYPNAAAENWEVVE